MYLLNSYILHDYKNIVYLKDYYTVINYIKTFTVPFTDFTMNYYNLINLIGTVIGVSTLSYISYKYSLVSKNKFYNIVLIYFIVKLLITIYSIIYDQDSFDLDELSKELDDTFSSNIDKKLLDSMIDIDNNNIKSDFIEIFKSTNSEIEDVKQIITFELIMNLNNKEKKDNFVEWYNNNGQTIKDVYQLIVDKEVNILPYIDKETLRLQLGSDNTIKQEYITGYIKESSKIENIISKLSTKLTSKPFPSGVSFDNIYMTFVLGKILNFPLYIF